MADAHGQEQQYIYIYIFIYIWWRVARVCICTYIYTYGYTYRYTYTYTYAYTYTYTYTYTFTYICAYTYISVYKYLYTHTMICVYMLARSQYVFYFSALNNPKIPGKSAEWCHAGLIHNEDFQVLAMTFLPPLQLPRGEGQIFPKYPARDFTHRFCWKLCRKEIINLN